MQEPVPRPRTLDLGLRCPKMMGRVGDVPSQRRQSQSSHNHGREEERGERQPYGRGLRGREEGREDWLGGGGGGVGGLSRTLWSLQTLT